MCRQPDTVSHRLFFQLKICARPYPRQKSFDVHWPNDFSGYLDRLISLLVDGQAALHAGEDAALGVVWLVTFPRSRPNHVNGVAVQHSLPNQFEIECLRQLEQH